MIVLDTHIWVSWVQKDGRLTQEHQQWLRQYRLAELLDRRSPLRAR